MNDPYNFLELESELVRKWVAQENKLTLDKFTLSPKFEEIQQDLLKVVFNENKIPSISKMGQYVYNLWQDENNTLGVWRRTTLEKYSNNAIEWETVIDFDQLSKEENIIWFYGGNECLEPEYERCLIYLAKDGSDSVQVREFDLVNKIFVNNGFFVDVAKSHVCWININEIFVMSDFGEDSLTLSGYPKIVKRWKRDTRLNKAEILFESDKIDIRVYSYYDQTPEYEKTIVYKLINFYESQVYVYDDLLPLDLPLDVRVEIFEDWLFVKLNRDWLLNSNFTAGSLLVIKLKAFIAGDRDFKVLFRQKNNEILHEFIFTKDFMVLKIMKDVSNHLEVYDIRNRFYHVDSIVAEEPHACISLSTVEKHKNEIFMTVESFIYPPTLYVVDLYNSTKKVLKKTPSLVDSTNYLVEQNFAISEDGIRVPYFLIKQKNSKEAKYPTLMEGYGGFEVSLLPQYLEKEIISWISRGGVYVVANVRGGGEYGPDWHQQALKQNRYKAYEDFAAVAKDLISKGITTAQQLAAIGGSNGGLLVGNMLTRYPELFGAIVCEVPLLDMLKYTKYGAGFSWIAEYGDPEIPEELVNLKKISPYHQLRKDVNYPSIFFYTSTSDDRVTPIHARKMAAKMRDMNIKNLYFFEQTQGGHSIFANKKLSAFHAALVSSYLFSVLIK